MRKITPEAFEVYTLDELEPGPRQKAIASLTNLLSDSWWDDDDNESVEREIILGFAEAIGYPGVERYGPGDFPGVDGVELVGWNLDQGDSVALHGELSPANAPALPWGSGVEGIFAVHLAPAPAGENTYIGVAVQDDEGDEPAAVVRAMQDAVAEAIREGIRRGRAQLEYLTSEQRAVLDAASNEREFTADGELYHG